MLSIILGRAGSGKTAEVFRLTAEQVKSHIEGNIIIVPEQYSHDAERELALVCPDDASLYAEVLSFSRLASRVFSELGGLADRLIDKGGRTLAMSRAISGVSSRLRVFNFGSVKADFIARLISAYDELRSAGAAAAAVQKASEAAEGGLGTKLGDLALIFEEYERIKAESGLDPRDRLDRLCESIAESSIGSCGRIFIDGFTDFTAQEMRVIEELIRKGADVTVTLTCDSIDSTQTAFELPARTARSLMAIASERGIRAEIRYMSNGDGGRPESLKYLERAMTDYTAEPFAGECGNISVWACGNITEECTAAAAEARRIVRRGSRWRDIAIVAPHWSEYSSAARGIFGKYGVPVNTAEKADILAKPIMAFVTSALDIVVNNWTYNDVMRYVKTGLSGISDDVGDLLENYIIRWNIRGYSMWSRPGGWNMHPDGYSEGMSDEAAERLSEINAARETVAEPLNNLRGALSRSSAAWEKAQAVYDFLTETELYSKLCDKTDKLRAEGRLRLADEYSQLWDILMNALGQFAEVLGDTDVGNDELASLFRLLLGQYEVDTIPSSVDSVGVGDMSRMRGRGIKHLIILGATDTALPSPGGDEGLFSQEERDTLRGLGIALPDLKNDVLAREMGVIYASFTMPSESLMFTYPVYSRRSYLVTRIEKLFSLAEKYPDAQLCSESRTALFELALSSDGTDRFSLLAADYFSRDERFRALKGGVGELRGRLTRETAEKLYGKNMTVSASRIDRFYSCRFSYFLQYGLKLRPRSAAALDAPENGTFMHYVLERTTSAAYERGGFRNIERDELCSLAGSFAAEYAEKRLGGLEDKTGRFKYLFSRLTDDAKRVTAIMADELRESDYRAIDFELRFAYDGQLPPVTVSSGDGSVRINGIVDRVDGWVHDDRLFLRVVDYKTGKKAFKLSDVYYGLGIQMLVYLFALEREGKERYGREIVPAGVLYAPARDAIIQAAHDLGDDELMREREKGYRRSGLLLDDLDSIAAMDKGKTGAYLPVRFTKNGITSDSLATSEQLGKLSRHVDMLTALMGKELREGSVIADPFYRGQMDSACTYCEYYEACRFKNGQNGDRQRNLSTLSSPVVWAKIEEETNG